MHDAGPQIHLHVVEHADTDACLGHLPPAERAHASRFRDPRRVARFANGRLALRTVLAQLTGVPVASVVIGTDAAGALQLACGNWQASVSHTDALTALALSRAGPVGVDIEAVRRVDDALAIARQYFHPDEVCWLRSGDPAALSDRFLRLWVRKEAVAKATGRGLALPLDDWTALARDPDTVGAVDIVDGTGRAWMVYDHAATEAPAYLLALATRAQAVVARPVRWCRGWLDDPPLATD